MTTTDGVPCPRCGADIGKPCVGIPGLNRRTGERMLLPILGLHDERRKPVRKRRRTVQRPTEQARTWPDVVRLSLIEQGRADRSVFVATVAPRMSPGWAWDQYVVDKQLAQRHLARLGMTAEDYELEHGEPYVHLPTRPEQICKAQRHLVNFILDEYRREGHIIEDKHGTVIKWKP